MSRLKLNNISQKIAKTLAPVIRKLSDINLIQLYGSPSTVLRIQKSVSSEENIFRRNIDVFGDYDQSLESPIPGNGSVINNAQVYIKYPFNNVELFLQRDQANLKSDVGSLDILEFLPIEMILQFQGTYDQDPIALIKDDLIVDVKYDEHDNILPVILQVKRIYGSFFEDRLVQKRCELSLYWGQVEPDIQAEIDKFVESLSNLVP